MNPYVKNLIYSFLASSTRIRTAMEIPNPEPLRLYRDWAPRDDAQNAPDFPYVVWSVDERGSEHENTWNFAGFLRIDVWDHADTCQRADAIVYAVRKRMARFMYFCDPATGVPVNTWVRYRRTDDIETHVERLYRRGITFALFFDESPEDPEPGEIT
jgi:hypothetical protein